MPIGARAIQKKKEDKVIKTSLLVVLLAVLVCIFATIYVGAQTMAQGNQREKVSQQVVPMKEIKITCPLSMVRTEITTPRQDGGKPLKRENRFIPRSKILEVKRPSAVDIGGTAQQSGLCTKCRQGYQDVGFCHMDSSIARSLAMPQVPGSTICSEGISIELIKCLGS